MTQYLQAISKITLLLLMGLILVSFIILTRKWFFFNSDDEYLQRTLNYQVKLLLTTFYYI